jgi:hypothetical protein
MEAVEGKIRPGCRLLGVTGGQYSLLELIRAVLAEIGPAHLTVSTWTAGIKDLDHASFLLDEGFILGLRIISDRSFPTRKPEYVAQICEMFGDEAVTLTNTHAKFALLVNDEHHVCIRTSMNLTGNPRLEYWEIDDDRRMFGWFDRLATTLIDETKAGFGVSHAEIESAKQIALKALDNDVTVAEYAEHRGITVRAVRLAIQENRCPTNDNGTIPVVRADKEWPRRRSVRDPTVIKRAAGGDGDEDGVTMHEAKLRFELARARKLERELDDERKLSVRRDVVRQEWAAAGAVVRDGLLSFPDRLTTELASALGTDARPEARDVIEREVRALLHSMADELESLDRKEMD